ncbi:MAG: hypothetical protein L3J84_07680 [Gammaproteobacteria bacterium]|nr:hypothetical protein [Gammaproteobacteria bacterium]
MAIKEEIEVSRSTRHPKIAGNFFESLVLYVMSKNGFECALIDHTGIDLLAKNPHTNELMGISVKGRTRNSGEKAGRVKIDNCNSHFEKIKDACTSFGDAVPYLAIVTDAKGVITGVVVPLSHIIDNYPPGGTNLNWGMDSKSLSIYYDDPNIKVFNYSSGNNKWWQ